MGRKVGDDWTVPLCATHHRALHDAGDEKAWWAKHDHDPLKQAETLWQEFRHKAQTGPNSRRSDATLEEAAM